MTVLIRMNTDDGKYSSGRVYGVSEPEALRLTKSRRQARLVGSGGRERVENVFVAELAGSEDLRERAEPSMASALVSIVFHTDVGKFIAGRVYGFRPDLAQVYCSQNRMRQAVASPAPQPGEETEDALPRRKRRQKPPVKRTVIDEEDKDG